MLGRLSNYFEPHPNSWCRVMAKNIISKRFNLVGAQENNESYLSKLIDDGILSKKTVEDHREIFPKISTSTPIDETIDPDLLYEWYLRFPYDFALWSWAIKNGNL